MTQLEQSAVPTHSTQTENVAPEDGVVAVERTDMRSLLITALTALVFVASAWFFYHQGERDALGMAPPTASMNNDATPVAPTPPVADGSNPSSTTTDTQTASSDQPDYVVVVHPTAAQMRAPAAKSTLAAKTIKPANRSTVTATPKMDRQVALATRPQPVYPVQALRAREQGTVMVLAQVDVNGRVSDARVVRRSGSSILDRAASNEVRRWQFQPALHDGQPVVASVEVPVSYRLGE